MGATYAVALLGLCAAAMRAQGKFTVPTTAPPGGSSIHFRDSRYGVRFEIPPGWNFTRKDREVSTFRLDARTATASARMRGVASLAFNPFPRSTLSGALVYFSVTRHANEKTCAAQASAPSREPVAVSDGEPETDALPAEQSMPEPESIGGMPFLHGHDQHGGFCVEARDEVYTAFRKGACYRFDLTVNTFCSVDSGAADLDSEQIHSIEAQMAGILSTVSLSWEKVGPQVVPVPTVSANPVLDDRPRRAVPAAPLPRAITGLGT